MSRPILIPMLVIGIVLSQTVVLAQAQLDPNFGTGGHVYLPAQRSVAAIEVLADGRFLVLGITNDDATIWRFHNSGALDVSFGDEGLAVVDVSAGQVDGPRDLKIDADGRIIVSGSANGDAFIVALTPAGSLDTTFNGDGKLYLDFGTTTEVVSHLWIDEVDGKSIYFSGNAADYGWYIGKITPDGQYDTSFNSTGLKYIGNYRSPAGIAQNSQGKIIGVSTHWTGSANLAVMVRLLPSGAYDNTFSGDGVNIFNVNSPDSGTQVFDFVIDGNDRVVLATTFALIYLSISRVNQDGSIDGTFGSGGTTKFPGLYLFDIELDSNNRPIAAGTYYSGGAQDLLVRLTEAGLADTSFSATGSMILPSGLGEDFDQRLAIFSDNDPVVLSWIAYTDTLHLFRIDVGEPQPTGNPIQNPGFETADSAQAGNAKFWAGSGLTGDKRKCNKVDPPKTYAHTGTCAFEFRGGPGEKAKISQTIKPDASLLEAGTALTLSAWIDGAPNTLLGKVVVYYTDGTKQAFSVVMGPSADYAQFTSAPFFLTKPASKFKVSFQHSWSSGKLYLDDVELIPNAARTRNGVLPVPESASESSGRRSP